MIIISILYLLRLKVFWIFIIILFSLIILDVFSYFGIRKLFKFKNNIFQKLFESTFFLSSIFFYAIRTRPGHVVRDFLSGKHPRERPGRPGNGSGVRAQARHPRPTLVHHPGRRRADGWGPARYGVLGDPRGPPRTWFETAWSDRWVDLRSRPAPAARRGAWADPLPRRGGNARPVAAYRPALGGGARSER